MSAYKLSAPLAVVMRLLMSFRPHDMYVSEVTTEVECRPQTFSFLSINRSVGSLALITNERGIKETRPKAYHQWAETRSKITAKQTDLTSYTHVGGPAELEPRLAT